MKNTSSARWLLKARLAVLCAALAGVVVCEMCLGESLTARLGQPATPSTQSLDTPSQSVADLVAVAQ